MEEELREQEQQQVPVSETAVTVTIETRPEEEEDSHVPRAQGVIVAPSRNPFGDEEIVCGVCLEAPTEGQITTLWCCRNVLCLKDAQNVGVCPFCREEPLVWELKPPQDAHPYPSGR